MVLSIKLGRIVLSLGLHSLNLAKRAIRVSVMTLKRLLKLRLLMSLWKIILSFTANIVTGLRIFMLSV